MTEYKDIVMKKITTLTALATSILLAQHAYAFEVMTDESLGAVTGQDGISITHEVSRVKVDQLNWVDPTDQNKMKMGVHNVQIDGVGQSTITSKLDFDVGTTDAGVGMRIAASVSPFTAVAQNIMLLCQGATCQTPTQNLGSLTIATSSPLKVLLETSNGLFNRNDTAYMEFQLQNASISHGMNGHSVTLKDFNFNFAGSGYMYVAADEGIVLTTKSTGSKDHTVNLGRVKDTSDVHSSRSDATNPGVNIDLRYGTDSGAQRNLIRMGASGAVTNARVALNANQEGIKDFGLATKASGYESVGSGGLHLGVRADFTSKDDPSLVAGQAPTTLEIGHTGIGSYAIEFSNLTSLVADKNAYIDFGDIYINTIQAKSLDFLVNDKLKATLGLTNNVLTQNLSNQTAGGNFALVAIRGMDFQSIARTARFISDNSIAAIASNDNSWGIGIPIYNMNANVALSEKKYSYKNAAEKSGIGYNLVMSTDGYGVDKKTGTPSTTSIILIDGKKGINGQEVNYYAGLRNINALIQSDGVIGYENDGIYVRADNLLIAANAELAIGQLPGSTYNCATTASAKCGTTVPLDNFSKRDDVLTNIAFKLDGKGELFIVPGLNDSAENNYLSFRGSFEFKALTDAEKKDQKVMGSYLSLMNEDVNASGVVSASSININKMQGDLGFDARIKMKQDSVEFDNQVKFNPTNNMSKAFRAEVSMLTNGNMQKMADIALTGGTMRSNMAITPR